MKKKSLKGFIKSRHFGERQKERKVSDLDVITAIAKGSLVVNYDGHNFYYGNLKVTVDLVNSTLITVHPGDPIPKLSKLLTKSQAKEISKLIELKAPKQEEVETNEFLKYAEKFSIKKI